MNTPMNTTDDHKPGGASYIGALIALLVLTAASYIMSGLDLGRTSTVLALAIAAVKAAIVALVFMHLLHSSVAVRFVLVVTVLFVLLLSAGMVSDVALR